ncbi:hypothetical protein GFS24_16885 [Chitinophaga sp. SYP-B3965]|uniref:hypothetical protein n=1 Tax=Chitinophaga sp. SYP-B3965 TaxID=2663120 RepID=UPI001299A469|nr:hypothetical protein [Chitinophaga sp. SYP-B3965]MRG46798.1 hypothetical protein [Chitinophaga sp. SYP-B3965]
MGVIDKATGEKLEVVIERLKPKDFKIIKKDKERFDKFDWNQYKGREVYKLRRKDDETILGLMCLTDHADVDTNAIEIELLEVSDDNIGESKKIDGIGGCLIAFACRESFKRGHDGCVFLVPKTYLVDHYPEKYGFTHVPVKSPSRPEGFMVLYDETAQNLIQKYL